MYETKAREISDALIRGENPELVTEGYENFDVDDWLKIGELIINVGVKKIKKPLLYFKRPGSNCPEFWFVTTDIFIVYAITAQMSSQDLKTLQKVHKFRLYNKC